MQGLAVSCILTCMAASSAVTVAMLSLIGLDLILNDRLVQTDQDRHYCQL